MKTILVTTNDYGFETPLTLRDSESGDPIDLTNATAIAGYLRAAGGDAVLDTLTVSIVSATDGTAKIEWAQSALQNRAAGWYEIELEIALVSGGRKTVYDLIPVYVRDEVGP